MAVATYFPQVEICQ